MRVIAWIGLALVLAGCVGYVQGDSYIEPEPDAFVFSGYVDGGAPARDYARRGAQSRGRPARPAARSAPPAGRPAGGGRPGGKR